MMLKREPSDARGGRLLLQSPLCSDNGHLAGHYPLHKSKIKMSNNLRLSAFFPLIWRKNRTSYSSPLPFYEGLQRLDKTPDW